MQPSLWSVVLAAGKGRRLLPLTSGMPKQFWCPAGTRSLLGETLARLEPLCAAERTVIVVGDAHRGYVSARPEYQARGHVLFQPADRGTAAGVLFGLTHVLATDPDGLVLLTPSDHGIVNAAPFRRGIVDAAAFVHSSHGVVLFGVEPSAASDDLGWISLPPGPPNSIRPVSGFVEKPAAGVARRLLTSGAIWNTMVLVARVRDLVGLSAAHLPEITTTFLRASARPEPEREAFLRARYPLLANADFSRDVLTKARGLLAYTWPSSIGWSDLGTPDRLCAWLRVTSSPAPPTTGAPPAALAAAATAGLEGSSSR
jgi:mannose-1-phosphate guanylyltransferase